MSKYKRILSILTNDKATKVYVAMMLVCVIIAAVMTILYTISLNEKAKSVELQMETLKNIYSNTEKYAYAYKDVQAEMGEIQAIFEEYGIAEDIDFEEAADNALRAFTTSLNDKYASFLSADDYIESQNHQVELGSGIGVKIAAENGKGMYIINVYDGSGAEKAGLTYGDYITSVNGTDITNSTLEEFTDIVSESDGTIEISYEHNGKINTASITPSEYNVSSVFTRNLDGIAYIKIDSFTDKTDEEFISVMNNLKSLGYEDYIIDLRNNLGGVGVTTFAIADYLVPEGLIIEAKGKDEQFHIISESDETEFDGNIVVLINGRTASASELLAQTLKEYEKATIVGETSFGKGTVVYTQQLESTDDKDAVTLSVAEYYTKSGINIEGVGVIPDIEVIQPEEDSIEIHKLSEKDLQLQEAISVLSK